MSTKKLLFTVLGFILAIAPVTVFEKKLFRIFYQCYVATWTVFLVTTQTYLHVIRQHLAFPQKIVFVILAISELFLDFSITTILCKHSRVFLKLVKFLTSSTWSSKCVVIWLVFSAIHALLLFFLLNINWYNLVGVYSFLRFNSVLMGLVLVFHLTKTRVKQFNQKIIKSSVLELQTLLEAQKKLFTLIDCLNNLFGAIIFWAVLTAICIALDYVCFIITKPQYSKQNLRIIGYYIEVICFEVS